MFFLKNIYRAISHRWRRRSKNPSDATADNITMSTHLNSDHSKVKRNDSTKCEICHFWVVSPEKSKHHINISPGTIYPGLMVTSATLYNVMQFLNITIDIRNVCVFLAPFFSSLTTIVTYLLTKELKVMTLFAVKDIFSNINIKYLYYIHNFLWITKNMSFHWLRNTSKSCLGGHTS